METVIRAAIVYLVLLVLLQIAGRRSMGQLTAFDFVLLLIISETTQQALVGENFSLINAFLAAGTLIGLDVLISLIKGRAPALDRWIDGAPLVLVRDGVPLKERLDKVRLGEDDVLAAARSKRGLRTMKEIRYAVLETDGEISIVPA